jgi:hypothetical protein
MDRDLLVCNIERYAAAKNESPSGASIAAGLGKNFVTNIRRGQTPSVAAVADLAMHLGVSVSDLIGDARQPEEAPELLACWAELNEEGREALLHVAQGFVYSGIYKNGDPDAVDQDA